jgi:hypothetical protein
VEKESTEVWIIQKEETLTRKMMSLDERHRWNKRTHKNLIEHVVNIVPFLLCFHIHLDHVERKVPKYENHKLTLICDSHTFIYSLLIYRDLCECWNVSIKFLCALLFYLLV